jgi:hypothetical protein
MKIIGVLLVIFGIIDYASSEFNDLDVWYDWFGIELPEILWMLSPWIEIGLGSILFKVGGGDDGDEE